MPRIWLFALFIVCTVLALPSFSVAQEKSLRHTIDAEIQAAWKENDVTFVAPATDAAFLRRVYLDLVGTIPGWEEAKAFLDDRDPMKRAKLIDRLLDDARFANHQADVWDLVLSLPIRSPLPGRSRAIVAETFPCFLQAM